MTDKDVVSSLTCVDLWRQLEALAQNWAPDTKSSTRPKMPPGRPSSARRCPSERALARRDRTSTSRARSAAGRAARTRLSRPKEIEGSCFRCCAEDSWYTYMGTQYTTVLAVEGGGARCYCNPSRATMISASSFGTTVCRSRTWHNRER